MGNSNKSEKSTVVLLHGLGRSKRSLSRLRRALEAAGYPTWARTYPSRRMPLDQLADLVTGWLQEDLAGKPLVAVTHSLGGVLVRHIGDRLPWQRIVMLAPPNGGSVVASKLKGLGLYRWIYGPAGQEVAEGENWPAPPAPCGVIAGTGGAGINNPPSWVVRAFGLLPKEPHDGTVTVRETQGAPHSDFATVDTGHSWIMNHPKTLALVKTFIAEGHF